jgi:polyisoprenoid-binding protein YceI
MTKVALVVSTAFATLCLCLLPGGAVAQEHAIDGAHTSVSFQIPHLGLSWIWGRFNTVSGGFTLDANDPARSSFTMTIDAESVDTGIRQRDDHLRSPDFLNVRQFPMITFKSTRVAAVEGGFEVTGDFTLHGQTRPLTLRLEGGKTAEFPRGVARTGFTTSTTIKRSDFGMGGMLEVVGDEVKITVSFEGTRR